MVTKLDLSTPKPGLRLDSKLHSNNELNYTSVSLKQIQLHIMELNEIVDNLKALKLKEFHHE